VFEVFTLIFDGLTVYVHGDMCGVLCALCGDFGILVVADSVATYKGHCVKQIKPCSTVALLHGLEACCFVPLVF
jgi:hypothetical protein